MPDASPDPLALSVPSPVRPAQPPPAAPTLAAPPKPPPVTMRRIGDYSTTRQAVFDNALEAVKGIGPVENSRYRLHVADLGYGKQPKYTLSDYKDAALNGRTLTHRISGTVTLTDRATGDVVDSRRMTVAAVPYMTRQGLFVLDGSPMAISSQLRLDPGVYTRKKGNGGYESHVAFLPGGGVPHRIKLDPESGVFKVVVGQAELPAVTMLRIMGATDDELKAAWGDDLAAVNTRSEKDHHYDRYYEKFGPAGPPPATRDEKIASVAARLSGFRFDPWITARTLGRPYTSYTKDAALAATKKLLDVANGRTAPDDRDHPAYSSLWGPEHLLAERLSRSRPIWSKLLWQATNAGSLKGVQPGFLTGAIRSLFTKSGLGMLPEGSNASEFMDHGARVTKVGEGGIGRSSDSVPFSARYVSAGQIPFIDTVRTSECFDPETEVMTLDGWKKWPVVTASDRFACQVDGKLEFLPAERLYVHDYSGTMYGAKNTHIDYLVTPNHRFWAKLLGGGWRWFTAEAIHNRDVQHQSAGHVPWGGAGNTEFRPTFVTAEAAAVSEMESDASARRLLGDSRLQQRDSYPIEPFAELLGWYLGEGYTYIRTDKGRNNVYSIRISQSMTRNKLKCDRIAATIAELGLRAAYFARSTTFVLSSKQLAYYFKQFGYSNERWIPDEFLHAPTEARRRLFEALLLAEGTKRKSGNGYGTFSSTSKRLADDFAKLAFSLGYSTALSVHYDKRAERYLPMNLVTIHSRLERQVRKQHPRPNRGMVPSDYYTVDYVGKVYCATVPGGKLYVRRNGSCGFWSGNSESVGVDLRMAFGTKVGSDKRLYAPLQTPSGRIVYRSPRDLADSVVAFPGARTDPDALVRVVKNGKLGYAPREEVDYFVPSFEQTFSPMTNMVPMKSSSKPHRSSMGARMITQALPLQNPEAPYVRSGVPGQPGKSFEELLGRHMGAVFAPPDVGGTVTSVAPGEMKVKYDDGREETHELYDHHPTGRKTGFNSYPLVAPGDRFGPGQILARTNYTDDKGHAAYGTNARVAFMPYRGLVFEDSAVVSRSFADRLTSHHLYRHQMTPDENTSVGRTVYSAAFPGKHTLDKLKTIGDDGVVKVGTVVGNGDPLILAVRKKQDGYARLSRSAKSGLSDASELWHYDEPGTVVDVRHTKNGPVVLVESFKKAQDGDKLSGRHGNKGVMNVVDDDKMPIGEDGRPIEAILSSLGTISRVNGSAVFEAALGKIAEKTGNPYVVHDFEDGQNVGKFVEDELNRHGIKFQESLTDPVTGRTIPNVGVGNLYLMKLVHMAEGKSKGRGLGGYDETGQPVRGGSSGSMRASLGDTSALMSYGGTSVLKDAHIVRGQAQDNFWSAYMAGFPVPHATTSKPFDRFLTELKGAGINPVRENGRYRFMGLKADDIAQLSGGREVKNGETLDASRDFKPYPGGLMDENTFGAVDSPSTWAQVTLHEPVLNPVFEEPARRLLGLTENRFRSVISGKEQLHGETGMAAIVSALKKFDVKSALVKARADSNGTRKTAREEANRKLGYLKHMNETGGSPADWVWNAVPVLPPAFRPVTPGRNGAPAVVSDANLVYRELIEANDALKSLSGEVEDVGAERLNMYDAVKAVTGLGDPITSKNKERGVKGVLAKLLGDTGKASYMQVKLLGTPVDLSGRGQVLPNPNLDMDQIGIPESIAWNVYHPFVVRRLVRSGVPRVEAAKYTKDQTDLARRALLEEMEARPILATRYPVLHRYGVVGFKPQLVKGNAIRMNNLVVKPLSMDFDGDQQFNSVIIVIDKSCRGGIVKSGNDSFWEMRDMSARFKTSVPAMKGDDCAYCVHLQDFPRGEKIGEKAGANGLIEFFAVDPRVRVIAYDETLGRPVLAQVSVWSVHHDREIEIVDLLSGRQIVSDDDPRAVYGIVPDTLEFVRCRPSEARGLLVPRVDRFDTGDGLDEIKYKLPSGDVVTIPLTESSGYVCGALVGNGWTTGSAGSEKQIHLACTDPGVRKSFCASFADVFGSDIPVAHMVVRGTEGGNGYGRSERLTVSRAALAELVVDLVGRGARQKHLPPFFLSGNAAFRRGLVRGLMDTDGSVSLSSGKSKQQLIVSYSSSSLRLVQEVQHLYRSLDVMAVITDTKTPRGEPFWILSVSAPDFQELNVSLTHTEKAAKFASAEPASTTCGGYTRNHMVPIPPEIVLAARKRVTVKSDSSLYYGLSKAIQDKRIARPMAERILSLFAADRPEGVLWDRFEKIVLDKSTVWDAVVGYKKTANRETGYDLTVPGYETFMSSDGVVLSNTVSLNVPLTEEAVQETYDKLLPSKNLFSPANMKATNWLPTMEYLAGLHQATDGDDKNDPIEFETLADARAAFAAGKINYSTRVRIKN